MQYIVFKNKYLFFGLITASVFLVLVGLGPGLFGMDTHESRWQHMFFEKLCHQNPNRSYSIAGVSMAVCSRCLGIYTSFAFGLVIAPCISSALSLSNTIRIRLVIGAILINAIDIFGNAVGYWHNTLESRLTLGFLFGFSLTILISNEFFNNKLKTKIKYGTEFTA